MYVSGVFSTPECPPKLYVTKVFFTFVLNAPKYLACLKGFTSKGYFPPLSATEIPKKSEHKILHF